MTTSRDYPRILVPPPGPKAKAVVAQHDQWASTSYPKEYPLVIAGGERAMVDLLVGFGSTLAHHPLQLLGAEPHRLEHLGSRLR